MLGLWTAFTICTVAIVIAGYRLSSYADIIAERSGLSRTWIGVVLLATITSLPELLTGISASAWARVPDIAVGDVFGSCLFNLLILAILEVVYRQGAVLSRADKNHLIAAGFGIAMLVIAGGGLVVANYGIPLRLGWFGAYTPILLAVYLFSMHTIYYQGRFDSPPQQRAAPHSELTTIYTRCGIAGAIIVAAATWLPFIGDEISVRTGIGHTLVGTVLVAFATSLPEIVTCLAALRLGALDLAVGNLFGSNLFNLATLAINDLCYVDGPILLAAQSSHLITTMATILINCIAVLCFFIQPKRKHVFKVSWVAILITAIYAWTMYVLYTVEQLPSL